MKKRIYLESIEGSGESFLEMELMPNGDLVTAICGQDRRGRYHYSQGQLLSPQGGGGMRKLKEYEFMKRIFNEVPDEFIISQSFSYQ